MQVMRVVADLDGSVSDDRDRQEWALMDPPQWDEYNSRCGDDTPITGVIMLLQLLWERGHRVEIWTGRPESERFKTVAWLRHYEVPFDQLRMRPVGDWRSANEIKGEWLDESAELPDIVLDDREQCVDFWNARGLLCLQVNLPGNRRK